MPTLYPDRQDEPIDDATGHGPASLYRSYAAAMKREFAASGGQPPTLAEAFQGMVSAVRSLGGDRHAMDVLARAHFTGRGNRAFQFPGYLGLDTILRAGTESLSGGSTYGFLVKPQYAGYVADKARHTLGPWSFCNIKEIPPCREYKLGINAETVNSMTGNTGNMFGGFKPSVGHGELVFGSTKSDGKVAEVTATIDRMLVYTQLSEDIWQDSSKLHEWLWYGVHTMIRNLVEYCMIQGSPTGAGPEGVLMDGGPGRATVQVARAVANQISMADIDSLWAGLSVGGSENAVWILSKPAMKYVRSLATSGTYPALQFPRDWSPNDPNRRSAIYGRPVLLSPYASPLGTPGDICAADFSDYTLYYVRPNRFASDNSVIPTGALDVEFGTEIDSAHRGFAGFVGENDVVEMRVSSDKLFDTDTLSVGFKARIGGCSVWPSTATEAGATVGWASVLTT